jgi:hypothetical protein
MLDGEVPIGRKLFEEIDKEIDSKIILENKKEGVTKYLDWRYYGR